jgi:hypothetical protein
MSKKYKGSLCVYCGINPSDSADHIISKSIFYDPKKVDIPQVPACSDCNNKKAKIEHTLSAVLPFGGRHLLAKEHLRQSKIRRRLARNIPLQRRVKKALEKGARLTSENESLPMKLPEELKMLKEYLIYVVKGLSYFHWQLYLVGNVKIEVDFLTEKGRRFYEDTYFKMKWLEKAEKVLEHNTIKYTGIRGCDKSTVWLFSLYGGLQVRNSSDQIAISSTIAVTTS